MKIVFSFEVLVFCFVFLYTIFYTLVQKWIIAATSVLVQPNPHGCSLERSYTSLWVINYSTLYRLYSTFETLPVFTIISLLILQIFGRHYIQSTFLQQDWSHHALFTLTNHPHFLCVPLLKSKFHSESFFPRNGILWNKLPKWCFPENSNIVLF